MNKKEENSDQRHFVSAGTSLYGRYPMPPMPNYVTGLKMNMGMGDITWEMTGTGIVDQDQVLGADLNLLFAPKKVIVKCAHCGQWGAIHKIGRASCRERV
jgi:hypothetical protein